MRGAKYKAGASPSLLALLKPHHIREQSHCGDSTEQQAQCHLGCEKQATLSLLREQTATYSLLPFDHI